MIIEKLDELVTFKPDSFIDNRGSYIESYNLSNYQEVQDVTFLQDDFSRSKKNVFRGFHGDCNTWKLVSCVYGEISLYIVNCNPNSSNFSKTYKFDLKDSDYQQVLIPPLFANAHLVKSEEAIFHYKQSSYYNEKPQFSLNLKSKIIETCNLVEKDLVLSNRDLSSKKINSTQELKDYISLYLTEANHE